MGSDDPLAADGLLHAMQALLSADASNLKGVWLVFLFDAFEVGRSKKKPKVNASGFGGEYRSRTDDLLHAMQAL